MNRSELRERSDNGAPGRARTYDTAVNSRMLCQLSYRGMAPPEGLEPYISALKGRRANLYTKGAYKSDLLRTSYRYAASIGTRSGVSGCTRRGYCAFLPAGFDHSTDYCELAVCWRDTFLYWVMYPVSLPVYQRCSIVTCLPIALIYIPRWSGGM